MKQSPIRFAKNSLETGPSPPQYRYGLTLTSQFYFCGLPLRLDTYSKCAFRCGYCFAHARGGAHRETPAAVYSADRLARRFDRIANGRGNGAVDELLERGQPIHFGGMSDPFSALETRYRASLAALRVLADFEHPTVISTKSDMLMEDDYLVTLKRGKFIVQVSLSSMDAKLIAIVDRDTPGPSRLMTMLRTLTAEGIPTSCRIQPILPTLEGHALDVVSACSEVGIGHIAAEHLKLGLEKGWPGTADLNEVLGLNLFEHFAANGARRVGREWILDVEKRLETVLILRNEVRRRGMTFGAADSDLLLLSDGGCCCSGADLLPGFDNYFRFNYLEAARKGLETGIVSIDNLVGTWAPSGSIAEHVNSHSRIRTDTGIGAGIAQYIADNWNGSVNGAAMKALRGVVETGEVDHAGYKLYRLEESWRKLARS